jgi:O-methyltransferase involved in polyketide biosynthesis
VSESIGPTARFTGRVWARHGLSHPALDSVEGRVMHAVWSAWTLPWRPLGLPSLDEMLLARHTAIDAAIEREVAAGRIGQVVELAAGMSPRGWRFTERHPDLVYVETDLPGMLARKREALDRIGRPSTHRTAELDVLNPGGLAALDLDPDVGVAFVSEGLLSYLPRDGVLDLWRRLAEAIARFPSGAYVSDLHVAEDASGPLARAFEAALSALVRGRVAVHFATAAEAADALRDAGFATATVAPANELIRVAVAGP